jgi:hypothetical protein
MRKNNICISVLSVLLLVSGCVGKGSAKKEALADADTVTVPDTGYTGIKKYYSGTLLIKQVTFKNGVRSGEMKSFYPGGQLYQTFWYENGLREDSSTWHYLEGQVFRSTPYKHDTIDGTQKQYYRNGRLKARINFIKGKRVPMIEEFTQEGKLLKGYPDILFSFNDNYKTTGKFRINLELSDKSPKVKFYRGEFTDGVFDSVKCAGIKTIDGKAFLVLNKTGFSQSDNVGIIAVILSNFGNNYITYKKIDLPYKDLK